MNTPSTAPSMQSTLQRAVAQGLLPAEAARHTPLEARPWPIMVVTALGAWLAIVPLVAFFGLLFGSFVTRGSGGYIIGPLLMGLAVVLLRRDGLPLFVEQLAAPLLATGAIVLGMALSRNTSMTPIALFYAALALALAVAVKPTWMRSVLGAVAAVALALALLQGVGERLILGEGFHRIWWCAAALIGVWLAFQAWARYAEPTPHAAQLVDAVADGWVVMSLLVLTSAAGRTFLLSGALGGGLNDLGMELQPTAIARSLSLPALVSVAAAAAAAFGVCKRWPSLASGASAAPTAVAVLLSLGLSYLMPTLGLAMMVAAVTATKRDWRIATLACAVGLWVVGSFYYHLQWPLAKALAMVVAGALLGVATWLAHRSIHAADKKDGNVLQGSRALPNPKATSSRWAPLAIGVSLLACLGVANVGIVEKEELIANGKPVFVRLMPVDPRSLMQGDFMRLGPPLMPDGAQRGLDARGATGQPRTWGERPLMVAKIGADRVAVLNRHASTRTEPLAADELLIELIEKNDRLFIASDAWFFREGEAKRWERARFAEYRITPDGRALLVNLRGEKLEAL